MKPLLLQYPACSTHQKTRRWLMENKIECTNRLIVEDNPMTEELKVRTPLSELPARKFSSTSRAVYKELKPSSRLSTMAEEEWIALLATSGKLVKRSLVVADYFVLIGLRSEEQEKLK